jgi:DNA-binding transcriptional LysR family regulator
MQMNLNQLRVFYFVALEKNITRAAERLFVTQPAVTMQIRAMEEQLSLKLFKRHGRILRLTEGGRVLFGYAKKIFGIVDEMESVIPRYADLSEGALTIGTTRSFARHLMPGLLSRFQTAYPRVRVSLKEGSSQEISDGLMEFKYDLGLVGKLEYGRRLTVVDYTREEFCLVTPPGHLFTRMEEVSLADLKGERIIIREEGSGSRDAIRVLLDSHGVTPSVLIEAGSVEFIKEYVIQGKGISFLYIREIELEAGMGLIIPHKVREGPILVQTVVIYPRDVALSPAAKAFLRLVTQDT